MRNLNEYIKEGLLDSDISKVKADIGELALAQLREINNGPSSDAGAKATKIVPEVIKLIEAAAEKITDWQGDSKYFNKGTYAFIHPNSKQIMIFTKRKGAGKRNLEAVSAQPGYNLDKSGQVLKEFYSEYKWDYVKLYKISDRQLDFQRYLI